MAALDTALDLPARWAGRDRFTVLLDTFGHGEGFAALWAAWRADPARCGTLHVVAQGPVDDAALRAACTAHGLPTPWPGEWPPATPDFHTLVLDGGRVRLLLALGDPRRFWRELVARVDAFRLDAPDLDPVGLPKALVRLSAPEATVSAPGATPAFRAALRSRGFVLADEPHAAVTAHYRPAFTPSRAPVRQVAAASTTKHAVIVGAGLAGAATALALARQGWHSTVIDRHADPAAGASGNPAGLFHGIVTADDGPHARFNRAASFEAHRAVTRSLEADGTIGSAQGLLRLEDAATPVASMRALLARLGLGPAYVQALDADAASAACGIALHQPAWFYPAGGWVRPGRLVRWMLAEAGDRCEFRGGVTARRIERAGERWRVFGADGAVAAESDVLVVANAIDALPLLGGPAWPLQPVRGQISTADAALAGALPTMPIAGGGYVMPPVDGRAVFGATAQAGDPDPALRDEDHAHNLAQLARLLGHAVPLAPEALDGRTAWRCVSDDRLPLIGEVPDVGMGRDEAAPTRGHPGESRRHPGESRDQVRFVPRRQGLFVFTGLGSRGITWSTLGGEVLAAAIAGAPSPLPASLLDAVDPARFFTRAARRAGAPGQGIQLAD
jgi:tRNA 5-methylaminomethyl-2-thiouridine biosynthesis bifunctional protein